MQVYYHCDRCGSPVAQLDLEVIDETKLGLDCLTHEQRNDIISIDEAGTMHIKTLCDHCIEAMGFNAIYTGRYGLYGRIQ